VFHFKIRLLKKGKWEIAFLIFRCISNSGQTNL